MLVRLAVAWTDPFGVAHGVGELVDIDAVTLAELEELGVVENVDKVSEPDKWVGPGSPTPDKWVGPGAPTPDAEANGWVGPGSPTPDDPEDPEKP
ncbi:hypothetical protein [Catellatospora sp. TT07R-123]|uniref:hypothetical protein n=1 Tax=Catellatospora sp. TT07R-123 TaxID=2733863 RepID=UPI001BB381C4|nr:hypothetical protein [Catellatospora sp. TT07R-123]